MSELTSPERTITVAPVNLDLASPSCSGSVTTTAYGLRFASPMLGWASTSWPIAASSCSRRWGGVPSNSRCDGFDDRGTDLRGVVVLMTSLIPHASVGVGCHRQTAVKTAARCHFISPPPTMLAERETANKL